MSPVSPPRPMPPFLSGGGALADLIAAFDWSRTPVGALDHWPAHMRDATSLMLRCQVPIVMLWGEAGVMVYNDAYAVFAGARHPVLLGSNVREGWAEVADFNDNVMKVGLAGATLSYKDLELVLNRDGRDEAAWMNLDYSPLMDESGRPAGVMAVVVETTGKVRAERQLNAERGRLATLFDQAPSFMAMFTGPQHNIVLANPNYAMLVGHRPLIGLTVAQALPDAAEQGYLALMDQVYASGQPYSASGSRYGMQREPGGPMVDRYVDFVFQPLRDDAGSVTGIFVQGVDVTDRVEAERRREALVRLTDAFRDLDEPDDLALAASRVLGTALAASRVGYGSVHAADGTLHVVSDWQAPGVASLAGVTQLRDYGSFLDSLLKGEFIAIPDVRLDPRTAAAAQALESRSARSFVNVPVLEQGQLVAVLFVNAATVRDWSEGELALIREVADRTRTAAERARVVAQLKESQASLRDVNENLESLVQARTDELMAMEEVLRQSQKMEAIGQLTGGIAHDFNNLLAGISGSLELMMRKAAAGRVEDIARYVNMAQDGTRRAAALTQRLLAFSRRQTLDPKPTDINRLIGGMEELIRRTVGPSVTLEVVGAGGLWLTKVDASQLENALLNLCINARDAMMPTGGRLTIETANKWLDDRAARERELAPGQYLSLCVTDTGAGMSADVVARVFDPFFTTKPLGQGTGLGLSMVYGFVRQSGGQVRVYSEPGKGTTMCLYLPRYLGEAEAPAPEAAINAGSGAGETVLVIDDEPTIRMLVVEVLQAAGYKTVDAADGPAGLRLLESNMRIDLLITDVGLPGGMNGRQVADAARISRPDLKVLFITGYAENAAVGNGLLAPGMQVITKPFAMEALAAKARELIDG